MKFGQLIIASLLVTMILISGCAPSTTQPSNNYNQVSFKENLEKQSEIHKFKSLEELEKFVEENQPSYDGYLMYSAGSGRAMAESVNFAMDSAESAPKSAGSGDDYSTTNVQVEGVDEADIVKTDGEYIYLVSKETVYIVDAKNMSIKSKIVFKSQPSNIYINEDNLIIFGNDYNNENVRKIFPSKSFTYFKVFDTTDKTNPVETKDLNFEGYYKNSRMVGDYVYFITDKYSSRYDDEIMPVMLDSKEVVDTGFYDMYYFPIPYNSYKFTTISAINVADVDETINQETYVLSDTQNMYVSEDNIYLTYTKYISEYELMIQSTMEVVMDDLSDKLAEKVQKIQNADSDVLTKSEKQQKIMEIIQIHTEKLDEEEQKKLEEEVKQNLKEKYEDIANELQKTVIHKISIDKNKVEYDVSGEVTGRVLNQFSMDEKDGYFRIATTKDRQWMYYLDDEDYNEKSTNNIYVLDEELNIVGGLEGLAEDEQIKSVRFMQNRAYMVTFRQIDPLFVIDLSEPTNPTVLGELKIPGYSTYLHPYDNDHVIGLGYDTYETKWGGVANAGVKLSMFDVSDVSNPKEVDTYILGDKGTTSIATYEHKAFLFSKEKELLVIPAQIRELKDEDDYWGELTFRGAVVFNVNEDGFKLNGKIDHSDEIDKSDTNYYGSYYRTTVKRSLYIGDELFTMSDMYIKKNNLSDLEQEQTLQLYDDEDYKVEIPTPYDDVEIMR